MQTIHSELSTNEFNLMQVKKERIALQCICCGSQNIGASPAVLMPFIAHRVFNWKPVEIDESWGLKSIKNGHAYSICNSLFCHDCGLLFLDIRFSDDEMFRLYKDYRGQAYTSLRESYESGYAVRNETLESAINYVDKVEEFLEPIINMPIDILDWGGNTGKNSPFQNRNLMIDIYDLSDKDVIEGARKVTRTEAVNKKYDVVVCSNVLEHVPFPSGLLIDIKQTMKSQTILYVEVPFEDLMKENKSDPSSIKKHWHEHINFFSKKSLVQLIDNCGLQLIKINELNVKTPCDFEGNAKVSSLFQLACKLKD